MNPELIFALLALALATADSADAKPETTRTTTKPVQTIVDCVVKGHAGAPYAWSFVLGSDGGGRFSNWDAPGVQKPFVLQIADAGQARRVRLTAEGDGTSEADRFVSRVVEDCL